MKTALIVAGGSGMGADAARKLSEDGFRVGILSSSGKGEALAQFFKLLAVPAGLSGVWLAYRFGSGTLETKARAFRDPVIRAVWIGSDAIAGRAPSHIAYDPIWAKLQEAGVPVHLFRLAGIYGPGRNALVTVLSGKARRIDDARGRYIEFCKASVQRGSRLNGLHIVLDCAHGATYHTAPGVFAELGARVTVISAEPDGYNINDGCGATDPQEISRMTLETESDLGFSFDGDAHLVEVDGFDHPDFAHHTTVPMK